MAAQACMIQTNLKPGAAPQHSPANVISNPILFRNIGGSAAQRVPGQVSANDEGLPVHERNKIEHAAQRTQAGVVDEDVQRHARGVDLRREAAHLPAGVDCLSFGAPDVRILVA